MKIKIFLLAFGMPLLPGLIFLFWFGMKYPILDLFIGIMMVVPLITQVFIIDRKYLLNFIITNDKIQVQYLTSFLKNRTAFFNVADLNSIEFTKPNWLMSYPAAINFKVKDSWEEFQLMNKNLKKSILTELAAANAGIIKMPV